MSAYMVNKEHIDALVELAVSGPSNRPGGQYPGGGWRSGGYGLRWATRGEARSDNADAVGTMLIAENLASIHHRYPDTLDGGTIPGPIEAYWNEHYVFRFVRPAPTAVEGLKLIDCYEYQSCEHPGWRTSEALAFCDALRARLVPELDGYDAAPWGWPARDR